MEQGFRVIRNGTGFSVEGYFLSGATQRFRSASGFRNEVEARAWVYERQVQDDQAAAASEATSD